MNNNPSTDLTFPKQYCPICDQEVSYSSRYPNYVCGDCIQLATDEQALLLAFFNTTVFGHSCKGRYVPSGADYHSNRCLIKGVWCWAEEAYMGGIVIRPV